MNPRPFDHESGAVTTELSPLPGFDGSLFCNYGARLKDALKRLKALTCVRTAGCCHVLAVDWSKLSTHVYRTKTTSLNSPCLVFLLVSVCSCDTVQAKAQEQFNVGWCSCWCQSVVTVQTKAKQQFNAAWCSCWCQSVVTVQTKAKQPFNAAWCSCWSQSAVTQSKPILAGVSVL